METAHGALKKYKFTGPTPGDSDSVGFGGAQEFLLLTISLVFFWWAPKHKEVAWRG